MNKKIEQKLETLNKLEAEYSKNKTLISKQDIIKKQIMLVSDILSDLLSCIDVKDVPEEKSEVATKKTTNTKKTTTSKTKKVNTKKAATPKNSKKPTKAELKQLVKAELDAWGLNSEWAGYKFLLKLADIAATKDLSKASYTDICKTINPSNHLLVKRSITFIRTKADFKKSKTFAMLAKMPETEITNEIICKEIIELF